MLIQERLTQLHSIIYVGPLPIAMHSVQYWVERDNGPNFASQEMWVEIGVIAYCSSKGVKVCFFFLWIMKTTWGLGFANLTNKIIQLVKVTQLLSWVCKLINLTKRMLLLHLSKNGVRMVWWESYSLGLLSFGTVKLMMWHALWIWLCMVQRTHLFFQIFMGCT
jgi:hypothetical protein